MTAPTRTASLRRLTLVGSALISVALLTPSAASAAANVGAVYTQSNDPVNNQVIAFDRNSSGLLTEAQRISTGGKGEGSLAFGCAGPGGIGGPPACPITDSQGSVAITLAGGLVFVTNAGSDTISSFRVSPTRGLTLVGQISSGGDFPQSLTLHGRYLYVLNEHSGNIDGFKFTTSGKMTEIPGSSQALVTPPNQPDPSPPLPPNIKGAVAAEVGFDHTGSSLAVTERATGLIDIFPVKHGRAGPPVGHPSAAPTPFGFTYDHFNHLLVTDAGDGMTNGFTSSYVETSAGGLKTLDPAESTDGVAPCWIVVTPDNRFAYVTNTVTKTIAEYGVSSTGQLTLLGIVPIENTENGPAQFPTDIAISRDGRFVYTIVPSVFDGNISFIAAFRVGFDGQLTFLTETPQNLPIGISGLAAR
ncbi:MAG: beta-propeller fold lactonase family protein [Actinobacteria bacterium]|nr:beta-propeller fold lactonase family protein [Actinomycetota bacterium]